VALADAEGFLPDSEMGALKPGVGDVLAVRITRAAQGGKGPRLSARLSPSDEALRGSGPPALLRRGPDALARLMTLYPNSPIRLDDPARAVALTQPFTLVPHAFGDAVEGAIAVLSGPEAPLPGGASMFVSPTRALVAIDVDLGAASAARRDKATAQPESNRALLPELCRQIRLRNLSGAIVVDLAGMTPKRRVSLAPAFAAALATDRLGPRFLGFSALGLAEILRPRIYPPLHEMLQGPHAAGLAALRALLREIQAPPHRLPVLRAHPSVAQALLDDEPARDALAQRAGRPLMVVEDRSLPDSSWCLEPNASV
jgi:hypothetical protein